MNSNSRLQPERLLAAVIEDTGLDDFGDPRLVGNFHGLIGAIHQEVDLSPQGTALLTEWFQRVLTNRLRMQHDFEVHPEINDEVLAPPIIITGLPRSGTTKLQQMLSAGHRVQALTLWRLLNFARIPGGDAARIAFADRVESSLKQGFPEIWQAHPTPAFSADEDTHIFEATFLASSMPMRIGAQRYAKTLTPADIEVYAFDRKVLQYLQWQDQSPDRAVRPWVVKCPIHIGNLSTIQQVFPGALVVHCHRDPSTSMASLARLIEIAGTMYATAVDRHSLGTHVLDYWPEEWQRNIEERPRVDKRTYCDVKFEDIKENAMKVMERIYTLAGLQLDTVDQASMRAWETDNTQHKYGKHEYSGKNFGLSDTRVREAFAAYFTYFTQTGVFSKTPP